MQDLKANETQTQRVQSARRNPEYRQIESKIRSLRGRLKQAPRPARDGLITRLTALERQQRHTPYYAKERRHPSRIGYVRYADDFVILVQGKKVEAQAVKDDIGKKLQAMGLALSEEKTKLTHWRHQVSFLGYQLHGKPTGQGTSIRPVLSIPRKKLQGIKEALRVVSGYHHIPETDAILQMSAKFRGWCHYYRYATAPQATFNDLARYTWWRYAHYVARKHRLSIARMIKQERRAGRLGEVVRNGRKSKTFRVSVEGKALILDLFPPRTGQIRAQPPRTMDGRPETCHPHELAEWAQSGHAQGSTGASQGHM